jgi:hypothetical protein
MMAEGEGIGRGGWGKVLAAKDKQSPKSMNTYIRPIENGFECGMVLLFSTSDNPKLNGEKIIGRRYVSRVQARVASYWHTTS